MKKIVFLFTGLMIVLGAAAKPKATATTGVSEPAVDRRVELMTIVARLAGYPEYQPKFTPAYTDSLDAWFAPYKEHPAVEYMRMMREKTGLSYNAVPIMGVYLTDPPHLCPLPLTEMQPESRWGVKYGTKFIELLGQFYRDTRCEEFFARQASLFGKVETEFRKIFDEIDMGWFARFFGGKAPEGMIPIIGMGFGDSNYAGRIVYPDSTVDQYAFLGSWRMDGQGEFRISRKIFQYTLIHEFCHLFVNPLQDAEPRLKKAGRKLLKAEEEEMRRQAYGAGGTVLNETMVRAAVIRYLMAYADSAAVADEMRDQVNRCRFIWMPEAVALLGEYEAHRDRYPDFRSFMPRVVEFFDETAARIDTIRARRTAEETVEGRLPSGSGHRAVRQWRTGCGSVSDRNHDSFRPSVDRSRILFQSGV